MNNYIRDFSVNVDLFWSKVKRGGEDECWPWLGLKSDRGYGKFASTSHSLRAHRIAFGIAHDQNPPAVCHSCDNRACCNPKHLWAGTNGLNNTDRALKGRSAHPTGEKHPMAKLTDEIVLEIRRIYAAGGVTQRALAVRFGLCGATVSQVVNGKRWTHLEIIK